MKKRYGFTLIELLIVIGIIAILAAIIYVAVDPAKRLGEARDAERWSSVNSVLNAYLKYTVDNGGSAPVSVDTDGAALVDGTTYEIGTGVGTSASCTNSAATDQVDLSALTPTYISSLPIDPTPGSEGTDASTGYYYIQNSGRITIGACESEQVAAISVTR